MRFLLENLKIYRKEAILAPALKMLEAFFDLFVPLVTADIINVIISYIIYWRIMRSEHR